MTRQELVPSSCINHPERPSTVRCRRCNVPICNKCKVVTAHGVYCSKACAEQMAAFLKKAASLDRPMRKAKGGLMRLLTKLVVLIVVAGAGWYLVKNGMVRAVWGWLMSILRTIRGG